MAKSSPKPLPPEFDLHARGIQALMSSVMRDDEHMLSNLLLCLVSPDGPEHQASKFTVPLGTPLMLAARHGSHKCLTLLLRHGANPYLIDDYNYDALTYAAHYGSVECSDALLTHVPYNADRLRAACLASTVGRWPKEADPIAERLKSIAERTDIDSSTSAPISRQHVPRAL